MTISGTPFHWAPTGKMARTYKQPYAVASHGGRNLVAGLFGDGIGGEDAAKAHAQLFAAAPALLAALQELAPELRIMAEWTSGPTSEEYAAKYERARQAIANATGGL